MRMVKSNEDDELIIGPTDLFDALQQGTDLRCTDSLPILNIHNTIHLRRKIQGKTLEYGIYQLNLQLHTHPASHKNSALWVSLLFVIQKRYKRMTSPK